MVLNWADWIWIALYFIASLIVGVYYSKRAGSSVQSFFVSSRSLPWWLVGTSMVATTFAADTPLAVTGMVALQVLLLANLNISLTLPGIAGIILSVGMGVDANVVISERIREELKAGKTFRSAVDAGFNRAFVAVLDSNITTLIAAGALYFLGTGPIRGFGLTLGLGVLVSFLSAVTVSRIMLRHVSMLSFARKKWLYRVNA